MGQRRPDSGDSLVNGIGRTASALCSGVAEGQLVKRRQIRWEPPGTQPLPDGPGQTLIAGRQLLRIGTEKHERLDHTGTRGEGNEATGSRWNLSGGRREQARRRPGSTQIGSGHTESPESPWLPWVMDRAPHQSRCEGALVSIQFS